MKRGLVLSAMLLLAACGVRKDAGVADVRKLVAEHGGGAVRWQHDGDEDRHADARVHELLSQQLTIDGAVEIALLRNRDLQATYEQLGVSQAELVQAGLLANPVIAASARYPDRAPRIANLQLSVTENFLSLFMLPLRKKFAGQQFERQKRLVAAAVIDLAADVRGAYYRAQAAQQSLALQKRVLEGTSALAELAGRQREAGNISQLDLALQEDLYQQQKLEFAATQREIVLSHETLTRLMGLWGEDASWKVPGELPLPPETEPPLEHLESIAIARRLDLDAQRREAAILRQALRLTSGWRYFATVDVGIETERDPSGVTITGPSLSLELPIFDRHQASIARMQAEARAANDRLIARSIDARSEIRVSRDELWRTRNAVELYRTVLVPLRERIVELSQQHYNGMLIGVYDLMRAKQNEIRTDRDYIEAVRDYWIARTNLERAAGGTLTADSAAKSPAQLPEGERK